ncbi:Histidine--tRNA ligase [Candidatus Hepatincolaceae symbiont of Richtersius coronifer]
MRLYTTVRGTHDLIGEELDNFNKIEEAAKYIAKAYNFKEIRTPIFEFAGVFEKNIGESTDIINKEMYIFEDRSANRLALRPEGTAAVVRALLSNKELQSLPQKLFYLGPMFRYERPQKGRQRQFHQFGIEYLGTNSYISDIEIINLATNFLKRLEITDYKLIINSLGNKQALTSYKIALLDYLTDKVSRLSADSRLRLEKNPLRILDSKDSKDKEILKDAPDIAAFLSIEDKEKFNKVLEGLTFLGIPFEIDLNLVRGLDYYTNTIFEIITTNLGAQGTLIAGGRYDHMIKDMGGEEVGSFGFGAGIERLSLMLKPNNFTYKNIAIITTLEQYNQQALALSQLVRHHYKFAADIILGKDIGSKLKKINTESFFATIIVGEKDYNDGILTLKYSVDNSKQFSIVKIKTEQLEEFLTKEFSQYKL